VNLLKQSGAKYTIAVNVFATTEELIEYQKNMEQEKALKEAQLASKSLPVRLFYFFRREISRTLSPFVFDVIMRSMQYMEYQIAEASSQEADITLHPSVPGSSWLEFYNPDKFIQKGEEEAIKNLAQLKQLTGLSTHSLTSTS
jgi:predicted acylesterase/phospholipase RssA